MLLQQLFVGNSFGPPEGRATRILRKYVRRVMRRVIMPIVWREMRDHARAFHDGISISRPEHYSNPAIAEIVRREQAMVQDYYRYIKRGMFTGD